MRKRAAVAIAAVAFVAGATAALAVSQQLSGDSVRTQAVLRSGGETFTVSDAAFNRQAIDIPGYGVEFQVTTPTWYSVSTGGSPFTIVLTEASGCDSPPPIGTNIGGRLLLKTPSTTTVVATGWVGAPSRNLLTDTGTYVLAMKMTGERSGLGDLNCDSLTFSTGAGWFFIERYPLR